MPTEAAAVVGDDPKGTLWGRLFYGEVRLMKAIQAVVGEALNRHRACAIQTVSQISHVFAP